jgi:hypothetical protein
MKAVLLPAMQERVLGVGTLGPREMAIIRATAIIRAMASDGERAAIVGEKLINIRTVVNNGFSLVGDLGEDFYKIPMIAPALLLPRVLLNSQNYVFILLFSPVLQSK